MADARDAATRFEVLKEVVTYWHGPVGREDGFTEEELSGIRMPEALRWWYRWGGKRKEITNGQNFLLAPAGDGAIEVRDGKLQFYVENQGVFVWGTEVRGEDPPVYGREDESEPWLEEGTCVTEHLLMACLFEAVMSHARYGASSGFMPWGAFKVLERELPALKLGAWGMAGGLRFYARGGAVMCAARNDRGGEAGYSVFIGSKTEEAVRFLNGIRGVRWDYWAA